tara:strand:+ start:272 stop:379 length:108 start_codon:yes stop_codon:yes gene_type:complete
MHDSILGSEEAAQVLIPPPKIHINDEAYGSDITPI